MHKKHAHNRPTVEQSEMKGFFAARGAVRLLQAAEIAASLASQLDYK